ncbi:hypothetical protein P9112_011286 [Eukaryota sp. TZLM1-RC]
MSQPTKEKKPSEPLDLVKFNAILSESIKKENCFVCPPSSVRITATQKDYISPKPNHVQPSANGQVNSSPPSSPLLKTGSLPAPSSHNIVSYNSSLDWCRPHPRQNRPIRSNEITKFAEAEKASRC